jgi:hypothetical protein
MVRRACPRLLGGGWWWVGDVPQLSPTIPKPNQQPPPPRPMGVPVRITFTRARTFGIFWTDV